MKHQESIELRQARQSVEAWRREHGGPGSAVPEAVWSAAVAAAKQEGIWRTSKTLRLNSARLKARTESNTGGAASNTGGAASNTGGAAKAMAQRRRTTRASSGEAVEPTVQQATFVDVGLGQLSGPKAVVALCNRGGDRMRIEVEATVDVVALAQILIGGGR